MINLTQLNGEAIVVNAELIALIEARPDTIITLTSGTRLTVREPIPDIIERVVDYRRRVLTPLRGLV
ncbi:MAG: flagellar FlbD family protein [Myxococcales bacterium]|nr:flagellar FlbD family protein [Myxococcota bacterium]MDW8282814.1 flagellar FlbD family protein [Myxococcales bacterium]